MNLKFYSIILVFFVCFSGSLTAQNIIYSNDENEHNTTDQNYTDEGVNSLYTKADSKIDYKVNVGTSFSSSSFANAVNFYTAPELRYKLSPKISISTGFLMMNTTVSSYYLSEKEKQKNFTQGYLFAGVNYKATEKLRISGEILYGLNKQPYQVYGNKQNNDYYLRFNAEYKITDNLSVGLQVINQNMGSPAFRDPFHRNPFGSYYNPFDPFSRY